jgi:PAS domain S-box-containing protein
LPNKRNSSQRRTKPRRRRQLDTTPSVLSGLFGEANAAESWAATFGRTEAAVVVADAAGHIVYATEAYASMHAYTPSEIVGRSLTELFPASEHAALAAHIRRLDLERLYTFESVHQRRDGSLFPVRVQAHAVTDADGLVRHRVALLEDLTVQRTLRTRREELLDAERRASAAWERAARQTATLQQLTAALSRTLTRHEVGRVVLDEALPAFGAGTGWLVLRDPDGVTGVTLGTRGVRDDLLENMLRFPLDNATATADAMRSGSPRFLQVGTIDDWSARYPQGTPFVAGHELRSVVVLPLIFESEVTGALSMGFHDEHEFPEDERTLMLAFAAQCAQALERARLHEAELTARQQAELANRAKAQFLATMSHELRTPLNAIAGYAQLIELGVHGPITNEQREDVLRIQRSQHHLLGLIDNILNFARIEAGRVDYRPSDVRIAELLSAVSEVVAPLGAAKGLGLQWPLADDVMVHADAEKARQVLLNLLSNAVKFTPAGGRVWLEIAPSSTTVDIVVHDTGAGIPPQDHERIFEPFVQLDWSLHSRRDGTGLGLAISRDLARGMGGELIVQSEVGNGSSFVLTLPRA